MLIAGQLLDSEGFCCRTRVVAARHPGRNFDVRNVHTLERIELRSVQPAVRINLGHDHTREIGDLLHLERTARGDYWAVGDVDAEQLPRDPIYFSSEDLPPDEAAVLRGIAITGSPAMSCMRPVRVVGVGADELTQTDTLRLRTHEPFIAAMLERTRLARRARRFGDRTIMVHKPEPEVVRLQGGGYLADGEVVAEHPRSSGGRMVRDDEGRIVGPLRFGPPGRVLAVR